MTFRRRYPHRLSTAPLLDLLLTDETNPRSVAFQLVCLAEEVDQLPHDTTYAGRTAEQRLVLSALTDLRLADINLLAVADSQSNRPQLDALLSLLAKDLPALSDAISRHYLSHLQPSRHLANSENQEDKESQ